MTRRDAAVLLFVVAGLYALLTSLSYVSWMLEYFAASVSLPPSFRPAVYFASILVPFGLLLAAGQVFIRARFALADQLFGRDELSTTAQGHDARVQAVASFALTVFGLLCLFSAVGELMPLIQLAQPYTWHSTSVPRIITVSVLRPALLFAYLWLGWWLVSRREDLATRWLIPEEAASQQPDSQSQRWETLALKVVGLYFVLVALRHLSHAFVSVVAGGVASASAIGSQFWRDALTGTVQLLFGIGVFLGKDGLVAAWRRLINLFRI